MQLSFDNGDRYFYTHPNIDPPLPEKVKLGEYTCRIVYKSRVQNCSRCQGHDHKTSDTEKCPAFVANQPELLAFTRGTFSNFDRCEVTMEGRTFMTSEHCYQWNAALEALRDDVAEAVIKAKSPWEAKQLAAPIKSQIVNWDQIKYGIMQNVLIAKACTSERFKENLMASDGKLLCEGLTDMYWGSGLSLYFTNTTKPQYWPGANKLGKILMNLRADLLREETSSAQPRCQPATVEGDSVSQPLTPQPLPTKRRSHQSKTKARASTSRTGASPLLREFLQKKHNMKRLKSVSKCSDLMGSREDVSAESDTASVSSSELIFHSVMDVGSDRGDGGSVT